MITPAKAIGCCRATFDRRQHWRVQLQPEDTRSPRVPRWALLLRESCATICLTCTLKDGRLRGFFCDMKVCHITGSRTVRGSVIHRRGLAKKKGGVGRHITKMVPRNFLPNLRRQRIWVPELKKFVRVRVTARALKTINKQGAYKALKKAGAI